MTARRHYSFGSSTLGGRDRCRDYSLTRTRRFDRMVGFARRYLHPLVLFIKPQVQTADRTAVRLVSTGTALAGNMRDRRLTRRATPCIGARRLCSLSSARSTCGRMPRSGSTRRGRPTTCRGLRRCGRSYSEDTDRGPGARCAACGFLLGCPGTR